MSNTSNRSTDKHDNHTRNLLRWILFTLLPPVKRLWDHRQMLIAQLESTAIEHEKLQSENEELINHAYNEARRPYLETVSPIPVDAFQQTEGNSSWRYFLEINSACNLKCTMCVQADLAGFSHDNGIMEQSHFEKIVDKIAAENNKTDICLYGNSEPFIHPRLAECITYIKNKGLSCLVSSNFNIIKNLDKVLEANPTSLGISVSGFSQEMYQRAHRGGDIEKVKQNMRKLAQLQKAMGTNVPIFLYYHLYKDNWGKEYEEMKSFAQSLGFGIVPSWARSISMEKTIQYLRFIEKQSTGSVPAVKISKAAWGEQKDWTSILPQVTSDYLKEIDRLAVKPNELSQKYYKYPTPNVCPVGDLYTYIRYDGSVSLCACLADRRLSIASNYLDVSQQEIRRRRRWQSICHECLRYKMYMYFNILDITMWEDYMREKFPDLPPDLLKY